MKLPENWKKLRIEDIVTVFKSGKNITSKNIFFEGKYPVFGGNGLRGFTNDYTHDGNYILIGRQGALCGNIKKIDGKNYVSEHAIAMKVNSRNFLNFWFYYLFFLNLNKLSESSAQPGLSVEKLLRLKIVEPPIEEQKAIADLLSTWDEAIEKTEKLIKLKERQFKWLLSFFYDEKSSYFKNINIKKIKIGKLLKESRILDKENNPQKRLSVKLHLKGLEIRELTNSETQGNTTYFLRKSGQFIYGKQNIFNGAVGIIPEELNNYSSTQDIPAFDFIFDINKFWFLFLFFYPNFYKKLKTYANGSGSKRLHSKDLFKIQILIPCKNEQDKVAELLKLKRDEIDFLKKILEKYKLQKKGLMQKLLTGTWRIKGYR